MVLHTADLIWTDEIVDRHTGRFNERHVSLNERVE